MATLDVTKSWNVTLKVNYAAGSVGFNVVYDSGRRFPWSSLWVSPQKWDRLVAWVELQRKEEALEKVQ